MVEELKENLKENNTPFIDEQAVSPPKKPKRSTSDILTKILCILVALMFIVLMFTQFVISPMSVEGDSMKNTMQDGNIVFVDKQAKRYDLKDIVVFKKEFEKGKPSVVKRIIGIPGDKISIVDGYVYRNGEKLVEDYAIYYDGLALNPEIAPDGELTVGEDELFVLGDNRAVSLDSSEYGCIKIAWLVGRVMNYH